MSRNHGDSFVPPYGQNQQQNFNPYGSYASSNTFYDPAFIPTSKQSSLGHGSNSDSHHQHQLESPYSVTSHHPLDPRTAPGKLIRDDSQIRTLLIQFWTFPLGIQRVVMVQNLRIYPEGMPKVLLAIAHPHLRPLSLKK
jgi:hypothetical protein